MTTFLDDLEIYATKTRIDGQHSQTLGLTCYGSICGDRFENGKKAYVIVVKMVRQDQADVILTHVLCHELEHYDLGKILTKMDVAFKRRKFSRCRYTPEWIHSKPSYTERSPLK